MKNENKIFEVVNRDFNEALYLKVNEGQNILTLKSRTFWQR